MAGIRRTIATAAFALLPFVLGGLAPSSALAAPLAVLGSHDIALYAAAFDAAERGDAADADQSLAQVSDPCLAGKVRYLELTRGKTRGASYEALANWLKSFPDMPGASEVYELALQRKPEGATPPEPTTTVASLSDGAIRVPPAPQSRAAREAYYGGDVQHALDLARSSGDAWIAGLAAYRLGQYGDAMVSFETLAANPSEADDIRAAGGFWAARAATAAGMADRAAALLKIAADRPDTFYGMIAQRKLQLADDPLGRLIDAADKGEIPTAAPAAQGETAIQRLVRTDPHARRAVALTQLGRTIDAGAELRAGFAEASDDSSRALWMGLMFELGPTPHSGEIVLHAEAPGAHPHIVYPTPMLQPAGGFTVEKALVYAVVWQESRFNSLAVSPVGAVGLMQLMPPSAANMAGDVTLTSNPITLFDSGKNLALGQAYLNWLEANAADYDILRTVAAYNGGPATLTRTEALLGPGADSLMVVESMPAAETRAYVKKVMAAYWTYRRQFGAPTRTLDAAASDMPIIDARLDAVSTEPVQDPQPAAATAREALEILLHHNG